MASSYYDTPFVTSVYMQTAGQLSNIIGIGTYKSFPLSFKIFVSKIESGFSDSILRELCVHITN